jgi:hypothetical protein
MVPVCALTPPSNQCKNIIKKKIPIMAPKNCKKKADAKVACLESASLTKSLTTISLNPKETNAPKSPTYAKA